MKVTRDKVISVIETVNALNAGGKEPSLFRVQEKLSGRPGFTNDGVRAILNALSETGMAVTNVMFPGRGYAIRIYAMKNEFTVDDAGSLDALSKAIDEAITDEVVMRLVNSPSKNRF